MTNTELHSFFYAIFGTTEGHLCLGVGQDAYRDENGKYKHHDWSEISFEWPKQQAQVLTFIEEASALGDVYACPYLMREPKRHKGLAASRVLVHADIDCDLDEDVVADLGGFFVRSGSSGHGHVYIPLEWPVTPEQHEVLCRGLSGKLGGDHKYSDNDLLRPPGSLNYKGQVDGGDPLPVGVLWCSQGKVDPRDLADKLGVDITNPTPMATTSRQAKVDVAECPVNLEKYPTVAGALADVSGDRSADTFRIVGVCRRAGLTLDEARWVVRTREDLRVRLDDRQDDDVLAAWLKIDAKERTAERLVSPASATVDGSKLLDEVLEALEKYVIFPNIAAAIAVTLWIVATHALPAWQHATRLVIRSPQKRCGKSRLLDVIERLCFNPMASTDASVAVLYRSIGDDDTKTVTLLIDEADALFGTKAKAEQNEDLRSLLNAGFQRGRSVWRCVGPMSEPKEFPTFSMAALAGIKSMPDTIQDRAVVIDLKRRQPGETVARFRLRRDSAPLLRLRDQLTAWAREPERLTALGDTEPGMPESVTDRAQDAWEPLIAIADAAGGVWPDLARAACEDLCRSAEDDATDVELLIDIHGIFTDVDTDFISSTQMVRELRTCDESPWHDKELTPYRLSVLLKPFGIKPSHGPGKTARGYWRRDFTDAFSRYSRPRVSPRPDQGSDQHEQGGNQ